MIFCRNWGDAKPVYPLYEGVTVRSVFDEENLDAAIPTLRRDIAHHDLDVFVAMLSEWLFEPIIEAASGLGVKVIASEHNDPWKVEELWWPRERRLACFSKVDRVHLLLRRFMPSLPRATQAKAVVIPNGVLPLADAHPPGSGRSQFSRIIAVGRLEPQKRFDRLIKAFAIISPAMVGWRLDIFGEGGERPSLQALIETSGLVSVATLRGNVNRIYDELQRSDVFVIPSEFEGFGIVVVEAQQCGLPCIGYSNCNGPNELISNNEDGLLVAPDETGATLAQALTTLIADAPLRTSMGRAGMEKAVDFQVGKVVDRWEALFYEVCSSD